MGENEKNPKTVGRTFFGTTIFRFLPDFFRWKSRWKFKIFEISKKWNFEILNFRWLFQRKKNRSKIEKNWSQKIFDQKVFGFFSTKILSPNFFGSSIPMPNFPKNPKIMLKTPSDDSKETKNRKNLLQNKKPLFFRLNPKYPSLQSPASDILCTGEGGIVQKTLF